MGNTTVCKGMTSANGRIGSSKLPSNHRNTEKQALTVRINFVKILEKKNQRFTSNKVNTDFKKKKKEI